MTEEIQDIIIDAPAQDIVVEKFLSYAGYVILDRALPDARDGLKPVQRRVIYSMHELGLKHTAKYKKCARVVGDAMGKYHPHGDCLRGGTVIRTLEGKELTIEEWFNSDVDELHILAFDAETGNVVPAVAYAPRIGQYTDSIYKITLSNGSSIEVTSNHPILLHDNTWVKAEDLAVNDVLYASRITDKLGDVKSSRYDNIVIVNIEVIDVDKEPMYDFTVDEYENMLIPSGKDLYGNDVFISVHNSSIYEALVNMAQSWGFRYPLVDGHGNFGSIDGHTAAAMRYTESRLSKAGEYMIGSIDKDTVAFKPNFDESEVEPEILPTLFPSLLANGTNGIGVGMASSILPHHVGSIYDAVLFMVNRLKEGASYTIDELISIIKMPDFPTGGTIINHADVIKGYKTGHGRALVRAVYTIETKKSGASEIHITEIPYRVNKASLIKKINDLRLAGKAEGLQAIRDESDKDELLIVLEIKRGADANRVLNSLFKTTELQSSLPMNHVAIFDGRPKQFTLQEALEAFLTHVSVVLSNENNYEINKISKRVPIIEAICNAIENAEEVIEMIRESKTDAESIKKLRETYDYSQEQAEAIIRIRIGKLSEENTQKYVTEYQTLIEELTYRLEVRDNPESFLSYVEAKLLSAKETFDDERRTGYEEHSARIEDRDLVVSKDLIVSITQKGMVKAVETNEYKSANRGSKGQDAKLKDDDAIEFMFTVNSRDDLLVFTDAGRCHLIEAYKLPIVKKSQQGKYLANYLDLENENIVDILPKKVEEDKDILLITSGGMIKRLELSSLSTRFKSTRVINFKEGDTLNDAVLMPKDETAHLMVFTAGGKTLRIDPNLIRAMGRGAAGVKLMKLIEHDYIVKSVIVEEGKDIILATENGYGKRIAPSEFNVKGRGGQGVKAITVNEKTGVLVAAQSIMNDEELFIATKEGIVNRIKTDNIRVMSAQAAGVTLINLNEGDTVTHVIPSQKEEDLVSEEEDE